jgi:hypothetical protein
MIGKTLKVLSLLSFAGALALVACSSDDAGEKYPSSESFCTEKADVECTAAASLCAATVDACKSRRTTLCQQAAAAASATGRTYRPGAAEKCINDTRDLYAAKTIDLAKEKTVDASCQRVFTGSKKKGEACAQPYDCEGTLTCDKVCSDPTPKKKGEGCNNPGDVCETGTYCGLQGEVKFCLAKNNVGDICGASNPCLETLRCVTRCQEKVAAGQPCDTGDDCTTGFCNAEKKCAAKLVGDSGKCSDFGGT